MPFRSQAQRKFMYAAEERGELKKGTADKWAKHTPNIKDLPEHVKKASFTKIAIALKRLKPVPAAMIEQKEALMATMEANKGKRPAADRAARVARAN